MTESREIIRADESLLMAELPPGAEIDHAAAVAAACRAIVEETVQQIQGRRYVRVEGWQAIAIAHGCVASSRDVHRVDGGYAAIGEIRRRDTGMVIATAEGFVGDDEPLWAKRPEYARRAMCQTRAISRACRSAFAHVVVMMNAGLETTPAEEIAHEELPRTHDIVPPQRKSEQKETTTQKNATTVEIDPGVIQHATARILRIAEKQTRKGATRYGLLLADDDDNQFWVNTFDKGVADTAQSAHESALECDVEYVKNKRGFLDVESLRVLREPGEEPGEEPDEE
jgi:hypothetical protein